MRIICHRFNLFTVLLTSCLPKGIPEEAGPSNSAISVHSGENFARTDIRWTELSLRSSRETTTTLSDSAPEYAHPSSNASVSEDQNVDEVRLIAQFLFRDMCE